ncbi:MAG TPA: DinB family protein [Puia sp.]|nr:DinB family protein [Puia sp.]
MDRTVEMLFGYRKTTLRLIEGLTMEALNTIPPGFNNNLIWNFGHVIVSQQTICYPNAGLTPPMDGSLIEKYRRGTRPEQFVRREEFERLKKYADENLVRLDQDLQQQAFSSLKPFALPTYGLEIANVDDMLKMLLFHEGLHLGYCMALKRAMPHHSNRSL